MHGPARRDIWTSIAESWTHLHARWPAKSFSAGINFFAHVGISTQQGLSLPKDLIISWKSKMFVRTILQHKASTDDDIYGWAKCGQEDRNEKSKFLDLKDFQETAAIFWLQVLGDLYLRHQLAWGVSGGLAKRQQDCSMNASFGGVAGAGRLKLTALIWMQ